MLQTYLWRFMVLFVLAAGAQHAFGQSLRHVEHDPARGNSAAVVVDDARLLHTAQLLPVDGDNIIEGDIHAQLKHLFARLERVLGEHGSRIDQVAKLNFYVANEELGKVVREALGARFKDRAPATSFVVTRLPHLKALVALDAVAVTDGGQKLAAVQHHKHAATLPPGTRIYISGQAEPGTLREATRKTLDSLTATLKHCGRSNHEAVQLKCFLHPMQSVAEVQDEIARYYGPGRTPPVVYVEWESTLPIEIELIAWGGPANANGPVIEYITPPFMKSSPVYSRVARIHRGPTIYLSDMVGQSGATPADELQVSFERLRELLDQTGSDLKHMAKATYYVTGDEINKLHNEIRPKYYDPARPPAASKAMIVGTGWGTQYTMDMIAVPHQGAAQR